ncbi:hypothetical protein DP155_25050 [Salmonella enterica subsp. enterica serovar Typhimurium]|nr:hypothetical protein DP155_25050 [Salmonella enterica subsp. enterica serovar Typhimurium]
MVQADTEISNVVDTRSHPDALQISKETTGEQMGGGGRGEGGKRWRGAGWGRERVNERPW